MMEDLICHSGMLVGSILSAISVVAVAGGLSVLVASALRRKPPPANNG
jgi:hypothetical protein